MINKIVLRNEAKKMAVDAAKAVKADLDRSQPGWDYARAWTSSDQGKRARTLISRDMRAAMEYKTQNKAACAPKGAEADLFR